MKRRLRVVRAFAVAALLWPAQVLGQEGGHDAWQTYMDAAAAAAKDGDDQAALVALSAAHATALQTEPKGARLRQSKLQLAIVNTLMANGPTAQKFSSEFKTMAEGPIDARLAPYLDTAKAFGDAFEARMHTAPAPKPGSPNLAALLADAAALEYGQRVRLLRVLRSDDKPALAWALLDLGGAEYDVGRYDAAIADLKEAIRLSQDVERRRQTLHAASRKLAPATADETSAQAGADTGDWLTLNAQVKLAYAMYRRGDLMIDQTPDKAAAEYRELIALLSDILGKYADLLIPHNDDAFLTAVLGSSWGQLCRTALKLPNVDRETCKREGQAALSTALSLYEAREGADGPQTVFAARLYAKFFHQIGDEAGAAELEARYPIIYGDETADFGAPPQETLQPAAQIAAPTPTSIPGARVIGTKELWAAAKARELDGSPFLLIDALSGKHARTIASATRVDYAGYAGAFDDDKQERLRAELTRLVHDDLQRPIVFFCQGVRCWESYNAALRAEKLGFARVYWYRGGIAAWSDAGLPLE